MDRPEHDRTDDDEYDIIKRILSGEPDEFRTLVLRHQDQIYALVMRQVGDAALARELSHETFVKAYRSLGSFRFASKFSTWLTRIAMNTTNSYFSSAQHVASRKSVSLDQSPELLEQTQQASLKPDIDERIKLQERITALRAAIGKLKPIYREVVTLCCLEAKTYEEAAEILEIPLGTVCSRLNTAQHQLRSSLKRITR